VGGAAPLLALKLSLVPALLAAISMAGKRWGPGVAGWLAGFPSLTGPILFFLALERGPEFTTQAAVLSLACVFSAISFGVTYAWACRRLNWFGSAACAFSVWTAAVLLLARLPLSTPVSLAISLATLFAAPRLFPRAQAKWGSRPLPASELLLRMAAGALMVLGVTAAAEALGSVWTGLFAAFPVMSTVLAVFSHRANGPGFVVALLRSMIGGFYAYIAYCLAVAALLETWGVAVTFTAAVAAAVIVQGAARAVVMRLASER
jgi:uncharacterized membrane protein (GlpM family)